MTRTAAADFSGRVRADLIRRRTEAAAKADRLQAEIDPFPRAELRTALAHAVAAVNAIDAKLPAST